MLDVIWNKPTVVYQNVGVKIKDPWIFVLEQATLNGAFACLYNVIYLRPCWAPGKILAGPRKLG